MVDILGELQTGIEQLAASVEFPLYKLLLIDWYIACLIDWLIDWLID